MANPPSFPILVQNKKKAMSNSSLVVLTGVLYFFSTSRYFNMGTDEKLWSSVSM